MKIIICEQYSDEWVQHRLGIPTASEFHRIITAVEGNLSKSAPKYAYALVAETLLNRPLEASQANTWAMQRGRDLEPAAAKQYEFMTDTEAQPVGLVTSDDGRMGCSPDRLISTAALLAAGKAAGGLEIKCTLDEGHLGIWVDGPGNDYKQQVQGSLLVADELEWWDLHAYHPDLPSATIRYHRDPGYQAKMKAALGEFLTMRDAMLAKAIASGFFEERAAIAAGKIPAPAGVSPGLESLMGLDALQASVILGAAKPAGRKPPKLEPVIACKLAKAAKAAASAAEAPIAPTPAPEPLPAPTPAQGKRAAATAAAQAGQLPTPPDFTAATHKPYRAKLAALTALVTAGDIEGLLAFEITATNSSPKALARYRDQAVVALRARQTRAG